MTTIDRFHAAMRELPLVAILRGLKPEEAPAIGDVLVEAGFRLIEVPLNSPRPLDSIAALRARFPDAVVGAGTVLKAVEVRE
nr:2-dehydro-3-deoxy-6-phosphogalactonate aldolase [Reyranella sp.]